MSRITEKEYNEYKLMFNEFSKLQREVYKLVFMCVLNAGGDRFFEKNLPPPAPPPQKTFKYFLEKQW